MLVVVKLGVIVMFNDVNYYSRQDYFDEHPYVVIETPESIIMKSCHDYSYQKK